MLIYAILAVGGGLALIFLEVLVPSGGLIGICACGLLILGNVLAFQHGATAGWWMLGTNLVGIPLFTIMCFNFFPRTPIGRKMILANAGETPQTRGRDGVSEQSYDHLVRKTGKATTPLRPSGFAEIDGERYTVTSDGNAIDVGTDIIVIGVEGNGIVVDRKEST